MKMASPADSCWRSLPSKEHQVVPRASSGTCQQQRGDSRRLVDLLLPCKPTPGARGGRGRASEEEAARLNDKLDMIREDHGPEREAVRADGGHQDTLQGGRGHEGSRGASPLPTGSTSQVSGPERASGREGLDRTRSRRGPVGERGSTDPGAEGGQWERRRAVRTGTEGWTMQPPALRE